MIASGGVRLITAWVEVGLLCAQALRTGCIGCAGDRVTFCTIDWLTFRIQILFLSHIAVCYVNHGATPESRSNKPYIRRMTIFIIRNDRLANLFERATSIGFEKTTLR